MPSLPERPLDNLNSLTPGTFDTMPSSGISSFYRYKDVNFPHTLFSVRDSYYLGTHKSKIDPPTYQPNAFLESATYSRSHAKIIVPLGAAFQSTFWTLVHITWLPYQLREIGAPSAPTHVLSIPTTKYLAALHSTSDLRIANTIPIDGTGDYKSDDDRFRNGIIDTPSFKGYQLISERFIFQTSISAGADTFALQHPTLEVFASSLTVGKWRSTISAMPSAKRVPQIYGELAATQTILDAAGIPRLLYRCSVQVQSNSGERDQFGPNLFSTFENVWPADCVASALDSAPTLSPGYTKSTKQSTGFFPNHPNGFLLEISLDQLES